MKNLRVTSINLACICTLLMLALPRVGGVYIVLGLLFCIFVIALKTRIWTYLIFTLLVLPYAFAVQQTTSLDLNKYQKYIGQIIELTGKVQDDAAYGYKRQVEFYLTDLSIGGDEMPGKVRVSGYGEIEVKRGDQVIARGRLFDGYGSYQARMSYADYTVIARQTSWLEDVRHKLIYSTYTVLPEPHASLGLGFLAGFRSLLPDGLSEGLATTGLTHIVAVSGYNTTILASFVQRVLARKGSRYQVVVLTSAVLLLFLGITGLAPSIIRACVVSSLSLVAWYYGRSFRPLTLLLLSAAITALIRPLDYWYSLGWWLSFAAFFGILIVAPKLIEKLRIKTNFGKLLVETASAQLLTLPIIMWTFSKVSAVALIANLLVLPFIPLAMLFTFLSGVIGIFSIGLGAYLAIPAKVVMSYMLIVIDCLAQFEWALVSIGINKQQMVILYLLIGWLTATLYIKKKKQSII